MTLKTGSCSNPKCHRPYTKDSYREAIVLMELGTGRMDFRIFSVCEVCHTNLTDEIVKDSIADVLAYETERVANDVTTSRERLKTWKDNYDKCRIINWGRNRMELDDKLSIK